MIAAGVGFRHSAAADEIAELVRRAASKAGLEPQDLAVLATAASRADEASFREAADLLALVPAAVSSDDLQAAGERTITRSRRVIALHGVGSVAEAAALSAAGPGARLLVARIASARATCALARGGDP